MILSHSIHTHATSKDWITFVHGAGGNSSIWYKQVKEFKKYYNVLLLDLRGHGKSITDSKSMKDYSFDDITKDIEDLLNYLNIEKSHFVGISLGSILISYLSMKYPRRVKSMILGGTILDLNLKSRSLLFIGNALKRITPFILLYQIFALIILPRKNHLESRKLFINEARKLNQKEFLRWFSLSSKLNKLLKEIRNNNLNTPTLFIQGEEDYMFIKEVKSYVKNKKNTMLKVIKDCGHVVNVESHEIFNKESIAFITENSK